MNVQNKKFSKMDKNYSKFSNLLPILMKYLGIRFLVLSYVLAKT